MEHNDFESWLKAADAEVCAAWQRNGGQVPWDEVVHASVTAHDVLEGEELDGPTAAEVRREAFRALMDFIWAEGPHPLRALKRLFHITLNIDPKRVYFMNQSQLARLLNETRAAFSARDIRVWEEFLEARGFFGTRAPGKKNDAARARYSAEQKGNHCRRGGRRRTRHITVLRRNATQPRPPANGRPQPPTNDEQQQHTDD